MNFTPIAGAVVHVSNDAADPARIGLAMASEGQIAAGWMGVSPVADWIVPDHASRRQLATFLNEGIEGATLTAPREGAGGMRAFRGYFETDSQIQRGVRFIATTGPDPLADGVVVRA